MATDIESQNRDHLTYVPAAAVAEALGGSAVWDNVNKAATITLGESTATVSMAAEDATVGGNTLAFSGPTLVEDGHMWVPVRFFEKVFGCPISIDGDTVDVGAKLGA